MTNPIKRSGRRGGVAGTLAIVAAVLLGVAGLATVGVFVFFVMAMNSYGSNK